MFKAQGRGPPSVIGQLIRWMLLKTKNFNNKKGNPSCPLVCKAQGRGPPSIIGQLIRWMLLKLKVLTTKQSTLFARLCVRPRGGVHPQS